MFRSDPEVQRFNSEPLQTLEQSVALIDEVRADYAAETAVQWALTLKSSGRVGGLFGYHNWHRYHRRADIGDLVLDLWGQGLAMEALTAIIRFGFSDMHLNRIEAQTIADNYSSTRLLAVWALPWRERGEATPGRKTAPSTTEPFTGSSATADQRLTLSCGTCPKDLRPTASAEENSGLAGSDLAAGDVAPARESAPRPGAHRRHRTERLSWRACR